MFVRAMQMTTRVTRRLAWPILILALALAPAAATAAGTDDAAVTPTSGTVASGDDADAAPEGEDAAGEGEESASAQASEATYGGFDFRGQFRLAYRATSIDGSTTKYAEDYDLDEGPRILDSRLVMVPTEDGAEWADQITLEADGVGGDPYRTWGITMQKAGTYEFRFRNRRVRYQWDVPGEVHAWDMTRWHQDGELTVDLSDDLEVYASFQRFRQERFRLTTRDIARAEFEFEEPLDQTGTTYGIGARWRFDDTVVFLEQSWRQFQDNGGFSDPATPLEESPTTIDFLQQKDVRAMEAPITRGGVITSSDNDKWRFSADFLYSDQELGFDFTRIWEGLDSSATPLAEQINAFGDIQRTILHANAKLLFVASEKVRSYVQYRRRGYDQDLAEQTLAETALLPLTGEFFADAEFNVTDYRITVDQYLAGLEVTASPRVALFGHVGLTDRTQRFDLAEERESTTERLSFKVGTRLRPSTRFDVHAAYEYGDIDDPFTRVSPTTANTVEVKARLRPGGGWKISGNYKRRDLENDLSGVDLLFQSFGADVFYQAGPDRWLVAGYSRLESDSEVPIVYIFPTFGNPFDDTALNTIDSNVVHGALNYRVSEDVPLVILGRGTWVDSSSLLPGVAFTTRSPDHEITRYDLAGGLRYLFDSGFFVDFEGRFIDYEEDTDLASSVDDFDATIYTIGLGVRF